MINNFPVYILLLKIVVSILAYFCFVYESLICYVNYVTKYVKQF